MADQTVKVKVGEDTHELSFDQVELPDGFGIYGPDKPPKGFMPQTTFEAELQRRLQGRVKADEIIADDDFFKKAAQKRGIQLSEDLKPIGKIDDAHLKQLQSEWESEKGGLIGELEQLRRSDLMRSILQAAPEVGIKQERLRSLFDSDYPEFVKEVASRFKYDAERKGFFFEDAQGNPVYSTEPGASNPYAGPKKLLEMLRQRDVDGLYFEDRRQSGSGFDTNGRSGRTTWTREQINAMSEQEFERHQADINRAMAEGRIR
jgi:hypothetical protein